MEQELVTIVMSKSFVDLSEGELQSLSEWCTTKEEFDQLKMVFQGAVNLRESTNSEPRLENKLALDQLFQDTYGKRDRSGFLKMVYPEEKPLMMRPLIQVAAIGLIALISLPFFRTNDVHSTLQTAKVTTENKKVDKTMSDLQSDKPVLVAKNEVPVKANKSEVTIESLSQLEDTRFIVNSDENRASGEVFYAEPAMTMSVESDVQEMSVAPVSAAKISVDTKDQNSHPDGIYQGVKTVQYAVPVSQQGNVLDLITASY